MIIEHLRKALGKSNTTEDEIQISYSKVPLTLALCKRKYDEEQRKKYKIPKDKRADLL